MRLAQHKELKAEIKSLPEKEKDKLLLRLIAKDKVLTEHLHFMLLENEEDLALRFEKLSRDITIGLSDLTSGKYNAKDTLLRMRKLAGTINHHFKVTKDVMTDLELRIQLLQNVPLDFKQGIFSPLYQFNEKLYVYFVKAAISMLNKFYKLHEDVQFDMKDVINKVLLKTYGHNTAPIAEHLRLPKAL
ncbi:MAG: hypothetical protein V4687_19140 [Bacteroidota bacterium]